MTDNTRLMLQVFGFFIMCAGMIVSGSIKASKIESRVTRCEEEIVRVDTIGCMPSIRVRQDLAGIQNQAVNNEKIFTEINAKLANIETILMNPVR